VWLAGYGRAAPFFRSSSRCPRMSPSSKTAWVWIACRWQTIYTW